MAYRRLDYPALRALAAQGLTANQIADRMGHAYGTVQSALVRLRIPYVKERDRGAPGATAPTPLILPANSSEPSLAMQRLAKFCRVTARALAQRRGEYIETPYERVRGSY